MRRVCDRPNGVVRREFIPLNSNVNSRLEHGRNRAFDIPNEIENNN